MLPIRPTNQFKKDLKKAAKQNRDITIVRKVIEQLAIPKPLPPEFRDHKLKGECHIEPDWLLIYTIIDFELRPTRLGTHSELFE